MFDLIKKFYYYPHVVFQFDKIFCGGLSTPSGVWARQSMVVI